MRIREVAREVRPHETSRGIRETIAKFFLQSTVAMGCVKHSQCLSAAPAKPWVAVKTEGTVVLAHCTCMAGLGEACSHIAAVLFLLEGNTQHRQRLACTYFFAMLLATTIFSKCPLLTSG